MSAMDAIAGGSLPLSITIRWTRGRADLRAFVALSSRPSRMANSSTSLASASPSSPAVASGVGCSSSPRPPAPGSASTSPPLDSGGAVPLSFPQLRHDELLANWWSRHHRQRQSPIFQGCSLSCGSAVAVSPCRRSLYPAHASPAGVPAGAAPGAGPRAAAAAAPCALAPPGVAVVPAPPAAAPAPWSSPRPPPSAVEPRALAVFRIAASWARRNDLRCRNRSRSASSMVSQYTSSSDTMFRCVGIPSGTGSVTLTFQRWVSPFQSRSSPR